MQIEMAVTVPGCRTGDIPRTQYRDACSRDHFDRAGFRNGLSLECERTINCCFVWQGSPKVVGRNTAKIQATL